MKRALVVGIDYYDRVGSLNGCVNDALALRPLLSRNEDDSPNFDVQVLVAQDADSAIARSDLLKALRRLFSPGADLALFYFAGHGGKLQDTDADVWLVTSDAVADTLGVRFDEIQPLIQNFGGEVVVILDACFSGAAGTPVTSGPDVSVIRAGVSVLAASRGDQTAAETVAGRGAFSTFLEGALEGGAADVLGHITVAGLYGYLSEAFGAWEQRPTFKANVDRLQDIRQCDPRPSLAVLRELPAWFPVADHQYSLDPSYEPTEQPSDDEHERIFTALQKCVASKLVEPVGADHMYFAAMESKACQLTALGKRYRRLAADGKL